MLSSFYSLSCDLTHMALASYLCDLSGDVVGVAGASPAASEGEEQDEMAVFGGRMLRMLLNSLYMLEQRTKPAALIKGVFEMRTAALSGFCPSLECCALCGKETPAGAYLDVMNGRLLCDACKARLNRGGIGAASEEALGERSILDPADGACTGGYALCACGTGSEDLFLFAGVGAGGRLFPPPPRYTCSTIGAWV